MATAPRPALTARQQKILDAIRTEIEQKGYPPSMRQIGDMVGLASLSSVTHQLGRLETMGYIRRDPKLPRAIEVLDENGVGMHGSSSSSLPELPNFEVGDETSCLFLLLDELQRAVPSPLSSPWRMCSPCPASWSVAASYSCSRSRAFHD